MSTQRVGSGAPWEASVGYSRAVRIGPHVWVAGTTGLNAEHEPAAPEAYGQAVQALATIAKALRDVGAELEDTVRTRMYITDQADAESVSRAHAEVFGAIRPAATLVVVAHLSVQRFWSRSKPKRSFVSRQRGAQHKSGGSAR